MSSQPPQFPQGSPQPQYPQQPNPQQPYPPQSQVPPYPGQQPINYYGPGGGGGVPCPRCGQYAAKPVSFTWWGGVIGPKMFNHHKCQACKYTFNGKTGRPNDTAIAIYLAISAVIGIALAVVFFFAIIR